MYGYELDTVKERKNLIEGKFYKMGISIEKGEIRVYQKMLSQGKGGLAPAKIRFFTR